MKKLLTCLTIGTFVSTNTPNINIVLNSNLNQKNNITGIQNLKSDPIVNWKDLGKKSAFADKINDNLFVLIGQAAHLGLDYLVDKKGTIVKELKMDNKNVNGGGFTRFNDNNIFFSGNSYFTSSYMMDLNGDFIDLGKRGIFFHFNDKIGVFREITNNKSYFLNTFGQFTEIKKDGQSIISQFFRFSDDLSIMVGNESWLMDSNGIFF